MARVSRNRPARVLIVDDQALYREGLREIMGHWSEFEVIGEASDGWGAVMFCRKSRPDLVVMDNKMPMMEGVEASRKITTEYDDVVVVMMSAMMEGDELLEAFDAGVRGYLLKESPSRQLRSYLKDALHGETVVSGPIARWLVANVASKPRQHVQAAQVDGVQLDADEREVVALVARGLSNEDIGARLYKSSGSVKKILRAVMDKLGLKNRVQIAVYAVRMGIG